MFFKGKHEAARMELRFINKTGNRHFDKPSYGKSQRKADENREGASNHGFMKRQNAGKLWKMAEKSSGWPPCLYPLHIQHNYP